MARSEGQKAKLLVLLQILAEKTDEDHLMAVPQLVAELEARGQHAERKSVYNDIETLREQGVDIEQKRGRQGGYYLGERMFQLAELKLLADAVQASRFITAKKSGELIGKLSRFASDSQAADLKRQVFASSRIKNMNESIYYSVDALHKAIAENHQVQFVYQVWGTDGKKHAKREGSPYRVSPWALLWEEQNYYLVAYEEGSSGLRHYRVDKMIRLRTLKQPRLGGEYYDPQQMRSYAKPMFSMYGGPVQRVTLDCDAAMANPMLDRFGTDGTLVPQPNGGFHLYADVAVSPPFFGWICGFGGAVRILEPASVRQQFADFVRGILPDENP